MNVLFFLKYGSNQASARVRGFFVAEELGKFGLSCDIVSGWGRYAVSPIKLMEYDIVFFHRCYFAIDIALNRLLIARGKKTVFDIDDNPAGISLSSRKERNAAVMMKTCSAVTVGSHALKDFAQNHTDRAHLIPSSIALQYYTPRSGGITSDPITLGWIGNGINYKQDLFMVLKPLENLAKRYRIKVVIIGALGNREIYKKFRNVGNVQLEIIDWVSWKDPLAVPRAISQFDIGLYPLLEREYNLYKCSFKGLEYLAMGIPVVASPVGENKIAFEAGKDGFLPSNEQEWEHALARLIEDEELRKAMGMAGRKKIEERYSTRVCARQLLNVFETIC